MTTTPTTSSHMPAPPPPPCTNILIDHLTHQVPISDLIREYLAASNLRILTTIVVIWGRCVPIFFLFKERDADEIVLRMPSDYNYSGIEHVLLDIQ